MTNGVVTRYLREHQSEAGLDDAGNLVIPGTSIYTQAGVISPTTPVTVSPGADAPGVSAPPFSPNDPSVLLDIGIAALAPRNTWTNLPVGFAATAATGQVIDDVIGFIPGGTSGNTAGRISATNWLPSQSSAQGTVYVKLARAAISIDSVSQSTSAVWYDSVGNATLANYQPVVFAFANSAGSASGICRLTPALAFYVNNTAGGTNPAATILNPNVTSAYRDPTYCELIVTWQGSQVYVYVDGILVWNGTLAASLASTTDFYNFSIGNIWSGANSSLGGCLGNFAIQRVQLSTAFFTPPVGQVLIGAMGDSYVGGSGGGGEPANPNNPPGTATVVGINGAQLQLNIPGFTQNGTGNGGQLFTFSILNSYIFKRYGCYLPWYVSSKSGYSLAYTGGYSSPSSGGARAKFTATITGTTLVVNSRTSGTPVVGMQIYGTGISAGTTLTAGAGTSFTVNNSQNVGPVTVYGVMSTTYPDALCAAQPQVVVLYQSVNDLYECADTTGASLDPVGDYLWYLNYFADRNPRLRAIILVEQMSLENFSDGALASTSCILNQKQMRDVAALVRKKMRGYFSNGTTVLAGGRQVPVYYVPIYEQMVASADGPQMLWSTNPNNIATSGNTQGRAGSAVNIHQSPHGMVRYADLIFPTLRSVLDQISFQAVGYSFPAGNTGTAPVPNCAQGVSQVYTMDSNVTVGAPINPPWPGRRLALTFIQDATGSRTIAWNAIYRNAPSWAAGTAGQRATAEFEYDGSAWQFIGGSAAFA